MRTGRVERLVPLSAGPLHSLAVFGELAVVGGADGRILIAGDGRGNLVRLARPTLDVLSTTPTRASGVLGVAALTDGRDGTLVSAGPDGTLVSWNARP